MAVVLTIVLLVVIQRLVMPKHMSEIFEGALVREYYNRAAGQRHDVIFIGDCEVYENFSPITLWEEFGIPSYIAGTAQQLIWQSYYLLADILEREKPKVVVFNALALKFNTPQREEYNRMSIDGMPMSLNKLRSAQASLTRDENLLSYVFPILRYHDRWQELRGEDFQYLFTRRRIAHQGYLMRVDVKPVGDLPNIPPLGNYAFGEKAMSYLDKMRDLCREKGAELILIKAPTLYPHWYPEWHQQTVEYAEANGLTYINFLDRIQQIGLDFSRDTYDSGLHLNLDGAEKLSRFFGPILREAADLPDLRSDAALAARWREHKAYYDWMKQDQLRELREFGELRTYTGRPAGAP